MMRADDRLAGGRTWGPGGRLVPYDAARHDFAGLLRAALGTPDLTALAMDGPGEDGWSIYKVMEQSASYRRWWALTGDAAFGALYARFMREVVAPVMGAPFRVQSCPTPRIVYRDQAGEPRFHRDGDYGHHPREVNFQVALTRAFATNAMWIESAPGVGDHRPVEYGPGEMLVFDGANLSHGAMPNKTGRSRVSFDFRAILETDAGPSHRAGPGGPAGDGPRRGAHVFVPYTSL